ncbi:unnamed protein product [Nippostrongylus brasiliensis]|uniref:glutathione transferase n=1 Tax=Nippostrongylus brasiliensis TaxID=27835 RepID=A0A0N4YEK0_NIPBR|nr:unnamed protein product [Nippostrongylus brasiliensis]
MVHYKLIYFSFRGRAEVPRQLFALAGQDYEDVRYTLDEWPKHKDEMPFGQMPVLEVDGKKLCQSRAIARFLAKRFVVADCHKFTGKGYAGKNALDEAVVDSIVDQCEDFFAEIRPYFRAAAGMEQGDVENLEKHLLLPARQKFFTFMTNFLRNNKSGYLVGDSLTWADLCVANFADLFNKVATLYDGFPEELAKIAEHHQQELESDVN